MRRWMPADRGERDPRRDRGCVEAARERQHTLVNAPVDPVLLHLEIRNAITQQTTQSVIFLKHGDLVPSTRQLLCCRQTR